MNKKLLPLLIVSTIISSNFLHAQPDEVLSDARDAIARSEADTPDETPEQKLSSLRQFFQRIGALPATRVSRFVKETSHQLERVLNTSYVEQLSTLRHALLSTISKLLIFLVSNKEMGVTKQGEDPSAKLTVQQVQDILLAMLKPLFDKTVTNPTAFGDKEIASILAKHRLLNPFKKSFKIRTLKANTYGFYPNMGKTGELPPESIDKENAYHFEFAQALNSFLMLITDDLESNMPARLTSVIGAVQTKVLPALDTKQRDPYNKYYAKKNKSVRDVYVMINLAWISAVKKITTLAEKGDFTGFAHEEVTKDKPVQEQRQQREEAKKPEPTTRQPVKEAPSVTKEEEQLFPPQDTPSYSEQILDRRAFTQSIGHDTQRLFIFDELYEPLTRDVGSDKYAAFQDLKKYTTTDRHADTDLVIAQKLIEYYLAYGTLNTTQQAKLNSVFSSLKKLRDQRQREYDSLGRWHTDKRPRTKRQIEALDELIEVKNKILFRLRFGEEMVPDLLQDKAAEKILTDAVTILDQMVTEDPTMVFKIKRLVTMMASKAGGNQGAWKTLLSTNIYKYIRPLMRVWGEFQKNPALLSLFGAALSVYERHSEMFTRISKAMLGEQEIKTTSVAVTSWRDRNVARLKTLADSEFIDKSHLNRIITRVADVSDFGTLNASYKTAVEDMQSLYQEALQDAMQKVERLGGVSLRDEDNEQARKAQAAIRELIDLVHDVLQKDPQVVYHLKEIISHAKKSSAGMKAAVQEYLLAHGMGSVSEYIMRIVALAADVMSNPTTRNMMDALLMIWAKNSDKIMKVFSLLKTTKEKYGTTAQTQAWQRRTREHLEKFKHKGLQLFIDQSKVKQLLTDVNKVSGNSADFVERELQPFYYTSLIQAWRAVYSKQEEVEDLQQKLAEARSGKKRDNYSYSSTDFLSKEPRK